VSKELTTAVTARKIKEVCFFMVCQFNGFLVFRLSFFRGSIFDIVIRGVRTKLPNLC
jgi:hypothetical protein